MSDISSYYAELYAEIDRRIRSALKEYRPDLSKASNGALPVNYVPVIGGTKIEDGSITEAKLSFDPATQAELDAEALARAAADTAEASTRAAADTALAAPSYVTIAASGTLANERVIAAGVNVQLTDGGANSTLEIAADHTHGVQASGEWTWKSAATTSDPGSNNVGVNNDSPSLATTLYINKFGPNTVDYSGILSALRANDTIYLQQASNAASWHRYDVTGAPTLSGSAYAVPVSTLGGSAQGTEPTNNTKVYIVINQGASPTGMLSSEDVQDIVGAFVVAGTGISSTYNDAANTLTIAAAAPSFSVDKNGTNQTSIALSTWTKVTWGNEVFDPNSNFASDKFTPTVAGKYLMCATVAFSGVASRSGRLLASIWKNGSEHRRSESQAANDAANDYAVTVLSAIVQANGSSDYFEIYVYPAVSGAGTVTIDGTAASTHFSGVWEAV